MLRNQKVFELNDYDYAYFFPAFPYFALSTRSCSGKYSQIILSALKCLAAAAFFPISLIAPISIDTASAKAARASLADLIKSDRTLGAFPSLTTFEPVALMALAPSINPRFAFCTASVALLGKSTHFSAASLI